MPTETFIDAGGSTKHRKSTGAGTSGDPSVLHNIIDGSVAVTGTFWQATQPVSIASSVPVTNVGTFAVQVDGAALTALQLLDNIVLLEDAAHSSGDAGIQALAVRNDSDTSLAGTTGDYTPLQVDANGYLKVNIKAGAGSGGTSATDDAAFTAGSGSGTPLMGFVTSDTVNSGDVGVVGMLDNRQLKVTLFDSSGAELSVGGGTQYDEDTAHSSGDKVTMVGVVRRDTPSSGVGADGDRAILSVDADGRLYANTVVSGTVSVSGTLAVTGTFWQATQPVSNGGTFAVQVSSALPAGTNNIGDVDIVSGTLTTVSTVTSLTQFNGQAIALNAGAASAGTLRVVTASDATIGLNAGTLVVGQVVQRPDVSNASDGSLTLTPKFARLSTASTGNQAIVAAVVGKKIRVLAMNIMATASTNAVWVNDGTADLHGNTTYKIPLDVTGATGAGGFVLPYCQLGWFETAATNRPLNINLGSANGITAIVTYVEV